MDMYRRSILMRLVLDNELDLEDVSTLEDIVNFREGNMPVKEIRVTLPPEETWSRTPDLSYAEKELLLIGAPLGRGKIQAIKSIKDRCQLSLSEAKQIVDRFCETPEYVGVRDQTKLPY